MTILSREKIALIISILLHLFLYLFIPIMKTKVEDDIPPIRIKVITEKEIASPEQPVKKKIIRPVAREKHIIKERHIIQKKVEPVIPQEPLTKRPSSLVKDTHNTEKIPELPLDAEERVMPQREVEGYENPLPVKGEIPEPTFTSLFLVSRMPVFKYRKEPVYPESARMIEKEGEVVLEVSISEEGKVIGTVVIKKAGYGFDKAAISAMTASTFTPAMLDDKPVAVKVRIPVKFRLID